MAVYFVLGSMLVAWGLGLAILGLLRPDFPPGGRAGRVLVVVTLLIVAGTMTALLTTTKREHPREEAAAKAAELKAEQKDKSGSPGTAPGTPTAPGSAPKQQPKTQPPPAGKGTKVKVTEKEFSIALAGGKSLKAGGYRFDVQNQGQIEHDLTIAGDGVKGAKTPLIAAGQSGELPVELKAGKYKLYCSVPGHEQAGMKLDVTVK